MIIIQEKTVSWATAAIGLAITVHTSTLMTLRRAKFAICRVNLLLSLYFHKQAYINFHIMENVTENICGMWIWFIAARFWIFSLLLFLVNLIKYTKKKHTLKILFIFYFCKMWHWKLSAEKWPTCDSLSMCNIFNDDDDDECQVECFMSFIFSCFYLFQNVTLSLMIMFLFCFSKMRHFCEKVANKKLYPNVYVSKKKEMIHQTID